MYLKNIYNKQRNDVVLSHIEMKRRHFTPLKSQKEELVPRQAKFQISNLQPCRGGGGGGEGGGGGGGRGAGLGFRYDLMLERVVTIGDFWSERQADGQRL